MVELAEARVMNKKMLKKLKRQHGHDRDEVFRGALAPNGSEMVVLLHGKHYHHHHHYHCHGPDPSGLEAKFHDENEEGKLHYKESKHHHRRGRPGRLIGHRVVIESTLHALKHHVKKHQQYCRGLGLDFQYHNQPQQGIEAATTGGAAPVMPSAPEAELMMKNLSLGEYKEANKP